MNSPTWEIWTQQIKLAPNVWLHSSVGRALRRSSNPIEALIFFRLLLSNCLNWKIYCNDHSDLRTKVKSIQHSFLKRVVVQKFKSEREETQADNTEDPSADFLAKHVNYCVKHLCYAQSVILMGKAKGIFKSLEGETNFILINWHDVLKSAIGEMQLLNDPRFTFSFGFYAVCAENYGGSPIEFFHLHLQDVKLHPMAMVKRSSCWWLIHHWAYDGP